MVLFDLVMEVHVVPDNDELKNPLDKRILEKGGLVGLASNPAKET